MVTADSIARDRSSLRGTAVVNRIFWDSNSPIDANDQKSAAGREESHPRSRFQFSGFQDHRHRPLGHLSARTTGDDSMA